MGETEITESPESDSAQSSPHEVSGKRFVADVLALAGGTATTQVLGIILAPVFTRIFAPNTFGISALFVSIVSVLYVVSNLRYEFSIMLPEEDSDAANLVAGSILVAFGVTGVVAIGVSFGGTFIVRILREPDLASYLWLIPVAVLINGLFAAFSYWTSRSRHFTRLSLAQISGSVVNLGSRLTVGLAGFTGAGTLIGSMILGNTVSSAVLGMRLWRNDRHLFQNSVSLRSIYRLLIRYRKFPLYGTWSAVLNSLSLQLPVFLLSAFFTSEVVGLFALSNRVVRMPLMLIGRSISQVFFQRASLIKSPMARTNLVLTTFRYLVQLSFPLLLMLALTGEELFSILFGEEWAEAGVYVQILAPWMFFVFISSPMSQLFGAMERQEIAARFHVVTFLVRLVTLTIGGYLGNPRLALLLFSIVDSVIYAIMNLALMQLAGISPITVARQFGGQIPVFLIMSVSVLILRSRTSSAILPVAIATVIMVVYYGRLLHHDHELRTVLESLGGRFA